MERIFVEFCVSSICYFPQLSQNVYTSVAAISGSSIFSDHEVEIKFKHKIFCFFYAFMDVFMNSSFEKNSPRMLEFPLERKFILTCSQIITHA